MTLDGIITALRELAPTLRSRYTVDLVGVFGSAARADAVPASDIDILIAFEPGTRYTLMTLAGIKCDIEAALGRTVDLVVDHPGLRAAFRQSVERDLVRVA